MTDAHCHVASGETRHFICTDRPAATNGTDVAFLGVHPWNADGADAGPALERLRTALAADTRLGVGEIGLDRLRQREIPELMRTVFERQLDLAASFRRPVVLHGAKCWGQVVRACARRADKIPAYLFHGFSRSDGLLPEIYGMRGFVSVGPQILNDHAVNYRELVKRLDLSRMLVESDRTAESAAAQPSVRDLVPTIAMLLGQTQDSLLGRFEENADRFASALVSPQPKIW